MTGSQPVVLKRNKSGQGDWIGKKEIYAVKPGVPSDDKKTKYKESMRVNDDKLTATLVTTRGYVVEG